MHIDGTSFGNVVIDKHVYRDVLIVDGEIVERDLDLLHKLFGTGHVVSEEEIEMLKKGDPDLIVIGNGQSGVLRVSEKQINELKRKCEVIVAETPEAIERINEGMKKGKKVNALIHVTC